MFQNNPIKLFFTILILTYNDLIRSIDFMYIPLGFLSNSRSKIMNN